jgi:hypothetical protein
LLLAAAAAATAAESSAANCWLDNSVFELKEAAMLQ